MNKLATAEWASFVNAVLDETDEIARRYFKNHGQVATKADTSPVTEADRQIEQLIRRRIEAAYPDHSIIGEEQAAKKTASPYCWVIDPIDGTKAFIAGKPTFTTLIGLLYEGVPSYGIAAQPISKQRWSAVEAYQPEVPLPLWGRLGEGLDSVNRSSHAPTPTPTPVARVSDALPLRGVEFRGLNIATTSDGYFSALQLRALEQMTEQGTTITHGGDAYAYMMLTEGKGDAVFDVSFQPHDIIPLLPILQQAGLWVGFFENGQPTDKVSNNVVVSRNPELGHELREQLLGL